MPDGKTRADVGDSGGHMEMYETGRYLTVTGHTLDGAPESVNQVRDEIESVHAEYIADDADSPGEQAGLDDATPHP
jgi:primase-polymerase (primpol)-like protein